MEHKLLGPDQCGAVSKCSAVDLTTTLTCDAEEAWKSGGVAGLFTMDDKGVFDGILRNWLLLRLWE